MALVLDTVVGMALAYVGGNAAGPGVDVGSARFWVSTIWFLLVVGAIARATMTANRLGGLVLTRDQQLAALTATSTDWFWEATLSPADPPGLVFTASSPAVSDLLGYPASEVVGRPVDQFVWPEDRALARAAVERALSGPADGEQADTVQLRWRHVEGHPVLMAGKTVPVLDRAGSVVGLRGARRPATSEVEAAARDRLVAIRHRVSEVLESEAITVALQPIVGLQDGRLYGVEVLARFPDQRGPDIWFAEAQEVGLGVDLELAALCSGLKLFDSLPDDVGLSVNASPGLIRDARAREALFGERVPIDRVTLEMTEHAVVASYEDVHQALAPLRERGLCLAVDDTGAGYASFAHVLRLRPDTIKLDRSLIGGIDGDQARRAFVTAVVLLALELGAVVTGEGVETPGELSVLQMLGLDRAQGYYLARPSSDPEVWKGWWRRDWERDAQPTQATTASNATTKPA